MKIKSILRRFTATFIACIAAVTVVQAYPDTEGEDLVIDAPWRTIRDYVPVLFFLPDFKTSSSTTVGPKIKQIRLSMYDKATQSEGETIFLDNPSGPDVTSCSGAGGTHNIQIIDPMGNIRSTLEANEAVLSHWHYVVRIPTACLGSPGLKGQPGIKHIKGTILVDGAADSSRVMRVVVDPDNPLPKFSRVDRHYDIHVHTIAEQTRGNHLDIDSAYKSFGGPLAMLIESAYAIGMVNRNLDSGNWIEFKNQISTTDHNTFFSGGKFDSGHPPRFGPTSTTNGRQEEFNWYRQNFGILGGEEVTLPGTGRTIASGVPAWGSHFLSYGGPHFEGPWHGGKINLIDIISDQIDFNLGSLGIDDVPVIDDIGTDNPLSLINVLSAMGRTNGFGYAAHPFSQRFGWPKGYFRTALGFGPFGTVSSSSPIITASGKDFVFKGSQVWNGKTDFVARAIRDGDGLSGSNDRNPFAVGGPEQFVGKLDWDSELNGAMAEYFDQVKRGLSFAFADDDDRRFARKVYMSAGTDAHGDFNFSTSIPATIIFEAADALDGITSIDIDPKYFKEDSNAFGRVRTYALVADLDTNPGEFSGPTPIIEAPELIAVLGDGFSNMIGPSGVEAYRDGNTILTDGPIGMFHLDSNCRFNSDDDKLAWHDSACLFENKDGAIGGKGKFDGGRTALVPRGVFDDNKAEVWVQTKWKGKNDYFYSLDDPSEMKFELSALQSGAATRVMSIPSALKGGVRSTALVDFRPSNRFFASTALVLRGVLGAGIRKSMFITNPIWTAPYRISIISLPATGPIAAGDLKVSVKFGISMETTLREPPGPNEVFTEEGEEGYRGAQISVVALDENGNSTGPRQLLGNRVWHSNNLVTFGKIDDAALSASNTKEIANPDSDWDADRHERGQGRRSYAVIVSDLYDTNLNRLNSIGRTFTIQSPTQ